jgi:replicative DNA helicase
MGRKPRQPQRQFVESVIGIECPEAEHGMIGLMVSDQHSLRTALASLNENCFVNPVAVAVFKFLKSHDLQKGLPTLSQIAEGAKQEGSDKKVYMDLVRWKLLSSGEDVASLTEILQKYRQHRELTSLCHQFAQDAVDLTNDPIELGERLQEQMNQALIVDRSDNTEEWHHKLLAKILSVHNGQEQPMIPFGLEFVDRMLNGGYEKGTLNIIAARSRYGKSALSLFNLYVNSLQGIKGGFVSMEMTHEQIGRREFSMRTQIPYGKIREPKKLSKEELVRLGNAADGLSQTCFYRESCSSVNVNKLRSIISRMVYNQGCQYVVVDYLQRMVIDTANGQNYSTAIGQVVNAIKAMAIQFDIPIVLLSQLNRNSEKESRKPGLHDLRDSGMIEEAADTIILIDRPELRENDPVDDEKNSLIGMMTIMLEKNRDGEGHIQAHIRADMANNLFGEYAQPLQSTPF